MFILSGLLSLLFAQWEIKPFLGIDFTNAEDISVNNFYNQYRFLRAVELGFGLFCLYLKEEIFINTKINRIYLFTLAAIPSSRLISILTDGIPDKSFIILMLLEYSAFFLLFLYSKQKAQ